MVLCCALNALEFIGILERMSHASDLLILMIGRKLPLYAAFRLLLLSFAFGLLFGFFQLLSCLSPFPSICIWDMRCEIHTHIFRQPFLSAQSMYMDLGRVSYHLISVRSYVRSFVRSFVHALITSKSAASTRRCVRRLTVRYCVWHIAVACHRVWMVHVQCEKDWADIVFDRT